MKLNVVEILTHRERGITLQIYEYKVEMRFIVYILLTCRISFQKKTFARWKKI